MSLELAGQAATLPRPCMALRASVVDLRSVEKKPNKHEQLTDAELGLECYVVVGNALHLLLHGMRRSELDGDRLNRLDAALNPVAPGEMLRALRALDEADRRVLAEACLAGLSYAGDQAEAVLGAPEATVHAVVEWLRQCQSRADGEANRP